jgi:hypothetical protein
LLDDACEQPDILEGCPGAGFGARAYGGARRGRTTKSKKHTITARRQVRRSIAIIDRVHRPDAGLRDDTRPLRSLGVAAAQPGRPRAGGRSTVRAARIRVVQQARPYQARAAGAARSVRTPSRPATGFAGTDPERKSLARNGTRTRAYDWQTRPGAPLERLSERFRTFKALSQAAQGLVLADPRIVRPSKFNYVKSNLPKGNAMTNKYFYATLAAMLAFSAVIAKAGVLITGVSV